MRRGRRLTYADSRMKNLLLTLLHLAVTTAKLWAPRGVRAVIAENLVLKQQLIVLRRGRQRAPNLTLSDRLLCGFGSLFLSPRTRPKARHRRTPLDTLRVPCCVGASQVPPPVLFAAVPQEDGTEGPERGTPSDHPRAQRRGGGGGPGGDAMPRSREPAVCANHLLRRSASTSTCVVRPALDYRFRPTSAGTMTSWLSLFGRAVGSLWRVNRFRYESIVLQRGGL